MAHELEVKAGTIEALDAARTRRELEGLVALLRDTVESGAAIGFMLPLDDAVAEAYWQSVVAAVERGSRILLVARDERRLLGTVQLDLAWQPNGTHRAEVQKLMVHSAARRRGIGGALLQAVESAARAAGRGLLVLDTRQGDAAERLYRAHGYTQAGVIPGYARGSDGSLHATVLFYRQLCLTSCE